MLAAVVLAVTLAACSSDKPPPGLVPVDQVPESASVLPRLSVQQSDVPEGFTVGLYPDGDRVEQQVTLDLCSANYPSEQLRVARRQVGVIDTQDRLVFSTEAVGYQNAAATAQAFRELRDAQAQCPSGFVQSPGGGEPLRTIFSPAPDRNWAPPPAGVDRLAFHMLLSDQQGRIGETAAVYMRRGKILLGLYFFFTPDAPPVTVAGQTRVDGVVAHFADRLADLPKSAIED